MTRSQRRGATLLTLAALGGILWGITDIHRVIARAIWPIFLHIYDSMFPILY